jgi:hypothetical protein
MINSHPLFDPTPSDGGSNTAAEQSTPATISADNAGSEFSTADFLRDAKNIESPDVTYVDDNVTPTDPSISPPNPGAPDPVEKPDVDDEPIAPPQRQPNVRQSQPRQSLQRKYDGLDEDEVPLFNQMSNAAYERIYPEWLKHKESAKELETLKKDLEVAQSKRYYEEEGAWTLHPEYREAQANLTDLDTEVNFWKEQFALVEDGKPWNDLEYNRKDGNYYKGEDRQPSSAAKAEILDKLNQARGGQRELQGRLTNIQSTFKSRHESVQGALKQVHQEMFGGLDITKPHIAGPYKEALSKFPKEFQSMEWAQMLAKSKVTIEGLVQILRSKEISANGKAAIKKVIISQGPGPGGQGSGTGLSTKELDARFSQMARTPMS